MTTHHLLHHFAPITEAPAAVARLRQLVLDLAVRGKLVAQEPDDEPAAKALNRIVQAKKQLSKSNGKVEGLGTHSLENQGKMPIGWQSIQFEQIVLTLQTGPFGSTLHQHDYVLGGTPVINPASIQNERIVPIDTMAVGKEILERLAVYKLRERDVVMGRRGEMGRSAVVTERESGWLCGSGSLILRFTDDISPWFIVKLLAAPTTRKYLESTSVGATMQNLNQAILRSMPIGLPPLAEQQRIVAKVDELMTLCDELAAAQSEREARRDRLVAATLHRLTTRPEHIQGLRQTILNLAVQGKLVPQDPHDEPASELLQRIQVEKEQLILRGEIKKQAQTYLEDNESLLPLLMSWCWTRLQDVFLVITDGEHQPPPQSEDGIPFLVIGNIRNRTLNFSGCRYVPESYYTGLDPTRRPVKGDILYTLVGSYGIPVLIQDDRQFCIQRHIGILRPSNQANARFLTYVMDSGVVFDQATTCATGIAQKTVPLGGLRKILIPLPPLAEQQRIVARVDELLALCDELAANLDTVTATRRRLLEAALAEALAAG